MKLTNLARFTALDFQMMVLGCLLVYGVGWLSFDVSLLMIAVLFGSCLGVQYGMSRYMGVVFHVKSCLVTGLSLSILLRSSDVSLAVMAGVIAIGSKFILRDRQGHIFNPANLALTVLIFGTEAVWVAPGQWGHAVLLVFAFTSAAWLVLSKAGRVDMAVYFLASYGGLLVLRALYLGDPLTLPLHAMQSGALLLFSFFMITDPQTTPKHSKERFCFALSVASLAMVFQFGLYIQAGFIYGLTITSFLWAVLRNINLKQGHYHDAHTS